MEDVTQGKPFKKELQVKLNADERLDYGERLSRGVQDLQALNEAKAESAKDYAARIKAAEASLGNISRTLSNGYEYRPVECYWSYAWDVGTKCLFRTDTGEQIKIEAISMEERQQQLDLEKEEEAANAQQ